MTDVERIHKREAKWMAIKELTVIAVIIGSYVVDIPIMTLVGFCLACVLVVTSSAEKSIYYLAFFSSFHGIFVYESRHMYFVMVALFIIKFLLSSKIGYKTIIYYLGIVVYSLLFCDVRGDFSFAKLIGMILLFAIPVIGSYADKINCHKFFQQYIFGFVVQTVIGFFVAKIPAMIMLFDTDVLSISSHQEMTRFFGLVYDSNFYALSNYVVVAYLLFGFKKVNAFRGMLVSFLVFSGLMTVSKSYFLVLGGLLVLFLAQKTRPFYRFAVLIGVVVVAGSLFVFISNRIGYNVIDMVTRRFIEGSGASALTTGRVEIWKDYIDIFMNTSLKEFLLGFGFNAHVEKAAHNTFIEFFFHYGIVGCFIWLAFFSYCFKLFSYKTRHFPNKTIMTSVSLVLGIFFLSAYTYEGFWIAVVVSFMTLSRRRERGIGAYAI